MRRGQVGVIQKAPYRVVASSVRVPEIKLWFAASNSDYFCPNYPGYLSCLSETAIAAADLPRVQGIGQCSVDSQRPKKNAQAIAGEMTPVRRGTILTTALLVLWLMVEPTLAQQNQALITGIGRMSCAYWLSEPVNEGEGWILGFWSGLNYANARTVGRHTDGERIITEVRNVCATRPSMTLVGATFTVYSEMASK